MWLIEMVRFGVPDHTLVWTRRALGLAGLVKGLALWPTLTALADPSALRMAVLPLPLSGPLVVAFMAFWMASSVMLLWGRGGRWAAPALSVAAAFLLVLDRQLYSNHLYLLAVLSGLVGLALWQRSESRVPYWPIFLLRAQASIIYGFAAAAKLRISYLTGAVLAASLGTGPVPDSWLVPTVLAPLAIGSVIVEAFLAFALWSPRLRAAAMAVGVLFHGAIVLSMNPTLELLAFALAMVGLYPLFWVDPRVRASEFPHPALIGA